MFGGVFVVNDVLDAILLIAFFFGLAFTALSLLIGAFDLGGGAHGGHGHIGHGDGHHGGIRAGNGTDADPNVFNMATILAFSTWFGGCAYLLRNGANVHVILSLAGGVIGGIGGAWIVLRLLTWIKSQETSLDARRERLAGAMGRITSPIRAGGTGEIVYELNGVRQTSAAKAPEGISIPRGADVIVLKRERGIAYVEPWKALTESDDWEERFGNGAPAPRELPPP